MRYSGRPACPSEPGPWRRSPGPPSRGPRASAVPQRRKRPVRPTPVRARPFRAGADGVAAPARTDRRHPSARRYACRAHSAQDVDRTPEHGHPPWPGREQDGPGPCRAGGHERPPTRYRCSSHPATWSTRPSTTSKRAPASVTGTSASTAAVTRTCSAGMTSSASRARRCVSSSANTSSSNSTGSR